VADPGSRPRCGRRIAAGRPRPWPGRQSSRGVASKGGVLRPGCCLRLVCARGRRGRPDASGLDHGDSERRAVALAAAAAAITTRPSPSARSAVCRCGRRAART
jgi:hypothetical protein